MMTDKQVCMVPYILVKEKSTCSKKERALVLQFSEFSDTMLDAAIGSVKATYDSKIKNGRRLAHPKGLLGRAIVFFVFNALRQRALPSNTLEG